MFCSLRCGNLPTYFAIQVRDTTKFNSSRRYSRIVLVTGPRSSIPSFSEVLAKKITELTNTQFVKVVGFFGTRITLDTSVDLPKINDAYANHSGHKAELTILRRPALFESEKALSLPFVLVD